MPLYNDERKRSFAQSRDSMLLMFICALSIYSSVNIRVHLWKKKKPQNHPYPAKSTRISETSAAAHNLQLRRSSLIHGNLAAHNF
ncbi:MAG TPA: hypothetical protein PL126_07365 [Candidatus Cloacimonadota bacterium]|nr:hypothetical protein [Candidatus Cloacimonadota bacterium]